MMSLLNGKTFSDQTRGAVEFPKIDNFPMTPDCMLNGYEQT